MNLKKKISLALIATMLLGTLSGCAGTTSVNKTLPDFSEDGIIYRSAWWCPDPTVENYEIYKESGLNTVFLMNHNFLKDNENYWDRTQDEQYAIMQEQCYYIGKPADYTGETMTEKALSLAKEHGLYVFLGEGNGYFSWIGKDLDVYEDFSIDYSKYEDVIAGVFSGDEPSEPDIAERAANISNAEKYFPNVPYFCNLFPWYADSKTQLESDSYYTYLDAYCEQFLSKLSGPRLLSLDYYPFQNSNFDKWLYNYRLVAQKALEYDADIHTFIQACLASDGSFDPLTKNDICLQVNTALAYGATAYSYYLYTPAGGSYISGLIDYDGKPVEMYEHAQAANAQVASLEKAFTHYNYVNTTPVTDDDSDFYSGAFVSLTNNFIYWEQSEILENVTASNRALITLLRDDAGNEAFYIVNFYDKDDPESEEDCTITLEIPKMKRVAVYGTYDCLEGETSAVTDGCYECTLMPGEGILVIPFRK